MGRDLGQEGSGEQAAWRDLVARLELPFAGEPTATPWPDRENLSSQAEPGTAEADPSESQATPSGSAGPAPGGTGVAPDGTGMTPHDTGRAPHDTDRAPHDIGRAPHDTGRAPHDTDRAPHDIGRAPGADRSSVRPGKRSPADRSRVIRPAGLSRSARTAGGQNGAVGPHGAGSRPAGASDPAGQRPPAGESASPQPADRTEPDLADSTGFADPEPWRPTARNLSADDYLNLADLGYVDYDTGDGDDRYIPPPLPSQPKLDPVAKGAWTALLGGPGYLLLATLLGWQMPGWAQLVAIVAFIAGFVVLVFRLGDGPSRRDGPDQGAVV